VQQFDAGALLEERAREVLRRAVARRRVGDLVRVTMQRNGCALSRVAARRIPATRYHRRPRTEETP
jgi:hypothetical protein